MTDPLKTVQALVDALTELEEAARMVQAQEMPRDSIEPDRRKAREAIVAGRALIAQMQRDAVQPAAWMWEQYGRMNEFCDQSEWFWNFDQVEPDSDDDIRNITPLYTHPAPSESSKAALSDEYRFGDGLEQAAFELWAINEGLAYRDSQHGVCFYDVGGKAWAWRAWLARAGITRKPLTEAEADEGLRVAGIRMQYMTHAITRKELWTTAGSVDVMSIVRAIEAAHGITPQAGKESGERWICLLCKSGRKGHHGMLDDGVTPCPNRNAKESRDEQ